MTGFGQAEAKIQSVNIKTEIRSINSRHFDFSIRMPSSLSRIEQNIKAECKKYIHRGKININIMVNGGAEAAVSLDDEKLESYLALMRKIRRKYKIKGDVTITDIMQLPDVFITAQKKIEQEKLEKAIIRLLKKALKDLLLSRDTEGKALTYDLRGRCNRIEKALKKIETISHKEPQRFKKRLISVITDLGVKGADSKRVEEEVAYLANKVDITEEIVRLRSHVAMFKDVLRQGNESGKRLEFIAQEMNRETNTIGSKAQHANVTKAVIAIKLEIEKIREQVQNVE